MKFVSLKPSSRDNKRYEIIFSEPKKQYILAQKTDLHTLIIMIKLKEITI